MGTLDEHGMRPSPEADRRTLIRRVTFDLTGLPPTPEEVDAFLADEAPDAYERVVNGCSPPRATASGGAGTGSTWPATPRTIRPERPPTRPLGTLTPTATGSSAPSTTTCRTTSSSAGNSPAISCPDLPRSEHAALGFIGLAPVYHKEPKLSAEVISTIVADEWDERVDTTTRGFLGLTVACARCHDHKFDPIATADYYALAGVMASTQQVERPLVPTSPEVEASLADRRAEIVDLELRLGYAKEMKSTARKQEEDGSKYDGRIAELEARLKTLKSAPSFDGPTAPAVRDAGLWVDGNGPLLDEARLQAR